VLAFARGAAFEERDGLRFTTIMPGVVDTAILEHRPEPPSAELRARMLHPDDVAAACLFAVSLPARAHVPEITILPTELQALGRTA
jgi:NADP-dependent 3-hydroxy acid dehydrogenase YdfG